MNEFVLTLSDEWVKGVRWLAVDWGDTFGGTTIRRYDNDRLTSIIERDECNIIASEETYCVVSKLYFKDNESMMNFQLRYL